MGIINGTFDENLDGWEYSPKQVNWDGRLKIDVYWDNGRVLLTNGTAGGCETLRPWLSQRFTITDLIISLDYETNADISRNPVFSWTLTVHDPITGDIVVYNENLPINLKGTIAKNVSQYIGKEATIRFTYYSGAPIPGVGCPIANMWIDNVILSPDWGTFRVSSVPGGADIYIDGAFHNITPETGNIDLTDIPPGEHTITLKKTDYYEYSETLTVYPGRIYVINPELEPQVGCITFYSDPAAAEIFLSERNKNILNDTGFITFKQICNLFWGDYKWKLVLEGYYPKSGVASITDATGVGISETLAQIGIGCIYFETKPPGAKIILDGADTGKITPDTVCNQSFGSHHYELSLNGYQIASGDITLVSTHGGQVLKELEPITATGNISFTSTPMGAEIFLDGQDQVLTTPATITKVPIGAHTYILKLPGYNDYTGTVEVLENQTAQVTPTLVPAEGCIYFNTTQAGARIFIDNVEQAGKTTPALICGLTLGPHTYMLSLTGYQHITGNVNLAAGQGTTVTDTLQKKGIGIGTIIGIGLLGAGVLGAVVYVTREKKYLPPKEYLKYPSTPR